MTGHLTVDAKDLNCMAQVTLEGAEDLTNAWRGFLGSSVAPTGTFGSSAAGTELAIVSVKAAQAADVAAGALAEMLQRDVDGLNFCAKHYARMDNEHEGVLDRLRQTIGNIF